MHIHDKSTRRALKEATRLRSLLEANEASKAILGARRLYERDPDDLNINIIASALLIDAGSSASNTEAINEGAAMLERMLAQTRPPEEHRIQSEYNLSNAFAGLYRILRQRGENEAAQLNLQKQKEALQKILLRRQHAPPELLPMIMTNYANVLDHLSRIPEAIDTYLECLALEPGHGLARGNCGVALLRYVGLSRQHRLSNLDASWTLLSKAVAEPATILRWAGPEAHSDLQQKHRELKEKIEKQLADGLETLREYRAHRQSDHHNSSPPTWLVRVIHDRLLLTFNVMASAAADDSSDYAYFDSLRYGLEHDAKQWSVDLINIFNSIKEDFASARYLFYHASHELQRLDEVNSYTVYGEPEGSAEFGLVSGLLKTSFRLAVDLLDKVALFLKHYLKLPGSARGCNFNTVWYQDQNPKTSQLNETVERLLLDNFPLQGLRDLQRDSFRQEYPARTRDARNALVHQWVTLHWLPLNRPTSGERAWSLEDFSELTRFMLRQAKSAILLLTAAVNVEEARRLASEDKMSIPQPLFIRKPISSRAAGEGDDEFERDLIGDIF